ncbi:MAG TPA: rhomboid-like protein [Gaiellaceae bacterium]|nr:rhomboid-like protein [Gaiellaceae bacterium]
MKQTRISAPATVAYLLILVATTVVLTSSSAQRDNHLLLAVSTNIHQLAHVPVRVLVASAFWTGGWWDLARWTVLFAVIVAPVEHRLGWRPTTVTFAAGHIGATLVVAAGIWSGVRLGEVNPADTLARDVGASYGFFAIAAFAAYLLAPRLRLPYLFVIIGYLAAKAALFHTFTDFGHVAAVAIGLACYPLACTHDGRARVSLSPRPRGLEPADAT